MAGLCLTVPYTVACSNFGYLSVRVERVGLEPTLLVSSSDDGPSRCARQELNLHALSGTATSRLRVCRFTTCA